MKVMLTGGGTAGHVTPHLSLIPRLKEAGYDNWLALEFEGIEDCLMGIKAGLENLKDMLENA